MLSFLVAILLLSIFRGNVMSSSSRIKMTLSPLAQKTSTNILSNPLLITLLNTYISDKSFLYNDANFNSQQKDFLQKTIEEAYRYFDINNRYSIGPELRAINKIVNDNTRKTQLLIDIVDKHTNKDFSVKVDAWQESLETIQDTLNELDRSQLLSKVIEQNELFEQRLVSEWLDDIIRSNAYVLRGVLIDTFTDYMDTSDGNDMNFIELCNAIRNEYQIDIRKIADIPLSKLDENTLKKIINFVLDFKTPEPLPFNDILKDNLKTINLLDIGRFSSDKVQTKTLDKHTKANDKKKQHTGEELQERISTDLEVSFADFKSISENKKDTMNIMIDDLHQLQAEIEPLARGLCINKVEEYNAEVEELQVKVQGLNQRLKGDIAQEENDAQIASTLELIVRVGKSLESAQHNLNDLVEDRPAFLAYKTAMEKQLHAIEVKLDGIRNVNDAMNDKVDAFKELPADFLNSYNVIQEVAIALKDREISLTTADKKVDDAMVSLRDARRIVHQLSDMEDNLKQKNSLAGNITKLNNDVRSIEDKLAIATVISVIFDNLDKVLVAKEVSTLTVKMQPKLDAITNAKNATMANIENIINDIYRDLKSNTAVELQDLLEKISERVLVNGSKPSIKDGLEIKRKAFFSTAHLYAKLKNENVTELGSHNSNMRQNIVALDASLQTIKEKSRDIERENDIPQRPGLSKRSYN
jgi:hypothetical protein